MSCNLWSCLGAVVEVNVLRSVCLQSLVAGLAIPWLGDVNLSTWCKTTAEDA